MKQTVVFYSYFDKHQQKTLRSQDGVVIQGEVTPRKVSHAVAEKWKKIGYKGNSKEINIVDEQPVF